MAVTSKGQKWEILHSLWIAWTFTIGFFNWIAFFYIGTRARQRKWLLWGLFYSIPFILTMIFVERPSFDGWIGDVIIGLTLLLGIISIIHAFRIRKEYLLRLEALQRGASQNDAALRSRIDAEYAPTKHKDDADDGAAQHLQTTGYRAKDTSEEKSSESTHQVGDTDPTAAPRKDTIDLNSASEQEMASLPGVGSIVAKRAVRLREERGGFGSVEDFGEALNLKPHVVERIKPLAYAASPQRSQRPGSSGRIIDI